MIITRKSTVNAEFWVVGEKCVAMAEIYEAKSNLLNLPSSLPTSNHERCHSQDNKPASTADNDHDQKTEV